MKSHKPPKTIAILNSLPITINELTILEEINPPSDNPKYKSAKNLVWVRCKCSCGKFMEAPLTYIMNSQIRSCGHLTDIARAENLRKFRELMKANHVDMPSSIYLEYNGKILNINQWSKELNINRTTILYRYHQGYPVDKILKKGHLLKEECIANEL